MNGLKLLATGRCLPKTAVSNEEMSRWVDTSDEWIASRTGIRQRYFCGEGETALTLAAGAARQALERSGIDPADLGCVLCATVSPDYATPSLACLVQAELGLPEDIPVLDVNAACSGFLYAVAAARGFLAQSGRPYALVIGCEVLSRLMDMTDRSTCVLFGDGAGACILNSDPENALARVQDSICKSDGSLHDLIIVGGGTSCRYKPGDPVGDDFFISMQGREVYKHAVRQMSGVCQELLERNGLTAADVDLFVPHQANMRIIEAVGSRLKIGLDHVFTNVAEYGNTSSASVPLALVEAMAQGRIKAGDRVLVTAFGSGLTWGAALLQF